MQKHIVILDDDDQSLRMLQHEMETNGYQVTGLPGMTTFEELLDLEADMFILDEQLPGVSGHILCIMLKSHAATADIPVILISDMQGLEEFACIGQADGFLTRPFETHALVSIVNKKIELPVKEVPGRL